MFIKYCRRNIPEYAIYPKLIIQYINIYINKVITFFAIFKFLNYYFINYVMFKIYTQSTFKLVTCRSYLEVFLDNFFLPYA